MKSGTEVDKARLPKWGRRNTARNQNVRTSINGCLVKRRRRMKQASLTKPLPQVPTPLPTLPPKPLPTPSPTPPFTPPPTPPPPPRPVL